MQGPNMRLVNKNYPLLNNQEKEQIANIQLSRASSIGASSMLPTLPTASLPPPSSLSSVLSTLTIHSDNSNNKNKLKLSYNDNLSDSGSHRSRTENKYKFKSGLSFV